MVLATIATLVTVVGPASPASAYPYPTVGVTGHGFGHGNGMGQYGALGYAIDEDQPYTWILDHYYGGTAMGTQADAEIGVRILALDGRDLLLTSAEPFTLASVAVPANTAARLRRVAGTWAVDQAPNCAGPWTPTVEGIDGTQQPEAVTAYAGDDVNRMLRVCEPSGNTRSYRGRLRAVVDPGSGIVRSVNLLPMETYLRGVLPRESPSSWGDLDGGRGMEALKAQAVAARSYAWSEVRYAYARTCDTESCQVYGGAGLNGVSIEAVNANRAVTATAGQVRRFPNGTVARTEFSSSTGGWTSGRGFPAVQDTGDDTASNPNHTWMTSIPTASVEAAFPQIGTLLSVSVADRNGLGEDGGRVMRVLVRGTAGTVEPSGAVFRSTFRLKSDWFRFTDAVLTTPAVAMATYRAGAGYWLASVSGEVAAFGAAPFFGSLGGRPLNRPIVGMAATPTGQGYWLVASDGGVFSFGDARFWGSMGGRRLNQPIVGMAATTSGKGYWMVASDGGIFSFGDALFYGSMGGRPLNQPIVGMAADPNGPGYWLVARDGGIFSFGSARFAGSTGAKRLNQPIVGMAASPKGGYWFVAGDGGIFSFGAGALFYGSSGGNVSGVTAMASSRSGEGYWLVRRDGTVFDFGDAAL